MRINILVGQDMDRLNAEVYGILDVKARAYDPTLNPEEWDEDFKTRIMPPLGNPNDPRGSGSNSEHNQRLLRVGQEILVMSLLTTFFSQLLLKARWALNLSLPPFCKRDLK